MDTTHIRLFIEVARRGSFATVARDHNLDPSSVSRAVAALEDDLGMRLFQRSTRRVALTEAGHLYLARVEGLVDELDHARDEALTVSVGPVGTLRLTTSAAFGYQCLVPLLSEFRTRYPALKLDLLLTDENIDLLAERVDLAIRLGPSEDSAMIGSKLMSTQYRVCASPEYLKTHRVPKKPQDLRTHRCLLFSLPEFRLRWFFRDRKGGLEEVPVEGDILMSNALALRQAAVAGVGPVLLPDWLVDEELARGRLVNLYPAYRVTATDFETAAWLLYPSRAYLPNKVRVMIDFLRENFS
jgi:DNA-binding transcriptional LysR family regulator